MKARLALAALLLTAVPAAADTFTTPFGQAPGSVQECMNREGKFVPCELGDLFPAISKPFAPATPEQRGTVVTLSPNSSAPGQYPSNSIPITGNATGSTSAVVGTLAARPGARTWICGFNVQAIGGTAAVGPITIAGLVGSSQVYQASASAAGGTVAQQTFTPCIPASAVNTAITITTTADGTATAVDVNSWGFQQ